MKVFKFKQTSSEFKNSGSANETLTGLNSHPKFGRFECRGVKHNEVR
jgi:hypothetical protein